ncbi:MAG: amidohydrolase family protein [Bacteroidia bacterium]|nr:amidohydrolase family protein [Bacteroidia bacterium]
MDNYIKVIDAHSHLWLQQDTIVDGKPVKSLRNGRSIFLGEEVQMMPPFIIDSRNTADIFLSNMNYARVSAAVVVQEFIDGLQNDYLASVSRTWPDRFKVCAMCDFREPGFLPQAAALIESGDFAGVAIPGHRLSSPLDSAEMMEMYAMMDRKGLYLSLCLHEDNHQLPEVERIVKAFPALRIAIGHFGMVTCPGWLEQIRLARYDNVMVESGGITWLFNNEFYPFDGAVKAIREAADLVGMDKLMWGSDYPRTITAITYRMSYDFVLKSTLLSDAEKEMFLSTNAQKFYGFKDLVELPYIKNMSE